MQRPRSQLTVRRLMLATMAVAAVLAAERFGEERARRQLRPTARTTAAKGASSRPPLRANKNDPRDHDQVLQTLGLDLIPAAPAEVTAASRISHLRGGLYVKAILPNSPGARAAIQEGSIIIGMTDGGQGHYETIDNHDIVYHLSNPEFARTQPMSFYVVSGGGFRQVAFPVTASPPPDTSRR